MPFTFEVTVPYYQVDQQGVVFNMWYFAWLDEAMSAFLGSIGHPYDATIAAGWDVQLVHTELDWRGSARWTEVVTVEVITQAVGTTSFTLGFGIRCGERAIAEGRTVYVVIATGTSDKRAVPPDLRAALLAAGAGS